MPIRNIFYFTALQLLFVFNTYANTSCELANDLVKHANELHDKNALAQDQRSLLLEAIHLCPENADAHNNLANLFGAEGNFNLAVQHFKQVLHIAPLMKEALFGLGKAYYDQRQFPLSLQAYTKLCPLNFNSQKDNDHVFQKIQQLLSNERYRVPKQDEVLSVDSLKLLYSRTQHEALRDQVARCGIKATVIPTAMVLFKNIIYDPRANGFTLSAKQQLATLAETLAELKPRKVEIHSYYYKNKAPGHVKAELEKYNLPGNPTIKIKPVRLGRFLPGAYLQRIDITLMW